MKYSEHIKSQLFSVINEMARSPWLFAKNPSTDFSRKRKLDFETTVKFFLTMQGASLGKELMDFFHYSADTPTVSAFNQQRAKLLPQAFEFLFHEFVRICDPSKTYKGYRLLACDGSDLNIALNKTDKSTYFRSLPNDKGFNQLHLNALYDINSRCYTDAIVQPSREKNEYLAMTTMVDRCPFDKNTIFIADRGYESYNVFAHVMEKGMYFLIRARDSSSSCMMSSFDLPTNKELDEDVSFIITKKQRKKEKADKKLYKFISTSGTFDYVDLHTHFYYPMKLRIVRFKISADSYEVVITNLPRDEFSPDDLKKLYGLRWGIETSFRELKYTVGLVNFHAKKVEYIKQEIYARLTLYNCCELITMHEVVQNKKTKHIYQINRTMAFYICRHFLLNDISPPEIKKMIQRNLLPVRQERSNPRKVKPKSVVSFLYRIA